MTPVEGDVGRGRVRRRRRAEHRDAGARGAARAVAGTRRRCGWRSRSGFRSPGGMGGGSADAAAVLRLAAALAPVPVGRIDVGELAASLGADVPSQLAPGAGAWDGRGRRGRRLPRTARPARVRDRAAGLRACRRPTCTGRPTDWAAWRDAEPRALGVPRAAVRAEARATLARALLVNDLEPAALSLAPGDRRRRSTRSARPAPTHALVSGSGPTVFGLCVGCGGAQCDGGGRRPAALADRYPGATLRGPGERGVLGSAGKLIVARFAQRLVPRLRRAQFPQGS